MDAGHQTQTLCRQTLKTLPSPFFMSVGTYWAPCQSSVPFCNPSNQPFPQRTASAWCSSSTCAATNLHLAPKTAGQQRLQFDSQPVSRVRDRVRDRVSVSVSARPGTGKQDGWAPGAASAVSPFC